MNLDPSNHAFDEKDLTVSVGTNNRYGYQLMVNTLNNANALVNVADNTETIDSLTASVAPSDFPANFWGIRKTAGTVSSGNYSQFAAPYLVSQSNVPVNNDITTLGFGAKVDYTKPSGLYNLNLEFKALPYVSQNYMQNLDTNLCTEEPTVVIDSRDEKAYTIRRLSDGRCWMVENLRFTGNPYDPDGTMTLSPTTSNVVTSTTLTYGESATGSTSGDSYTDAKLHVGTVASGMSPIDSSATARSNIPTVWYNYVTVSAGTITTNSNTNEGQYDICPAGWRIPSYNEIGGILGLNDVDEFSPIVGGFYNGGVISADANGYYWTSFPSNTTSHWTMRYTGGGSLNTASVRRENSAYVRCILNEPVGNVTTLQQFGAASDKTALKNSMVVGKPYSLKDTRDNHMYTVAKLKDGNVWLSNNLNLGATALNGNLTSANTNLSSTITTTVFAGWQKAAGTGTFTAGEFITNVNIDDVSRNAYGLLYNYCATSATTLCTNGNNNRDIAYDICPSGWKLPAQSDFTTLFSQYNTAGLARAPIAEGGAAYSLSGYFYNAAPVFNNSGYYWSATTYAVNNRYIYQVTAASIQNTRNTNEVGYSIRCLLK